MLSGEYSPGVSQRFSRRGVHRDDERFLKSVFSPGQIGFAIGNQVAVVRV
jgi:hypothetical protein